MPWLDPLQVLQRHYVRIKLQIYDRLYIFRISRLFRECFHETPQNTKHSLYTFHISCKFCVSLMPRKNKPRNPLIYRVNINTGAKHCEMRKKGHKTLK